MNTVERVKSICKERKIPISRLEKDCKFSNGYMGQLKKGTMTDDRLRTVSEYLDVSMDYLMTGKESAEKPEIPEYDKETMELIILFSKLKKEQKSAILNMMRSFALEN